MPNLDLNDLLQEWPYEPEHNIRRLVDNDGREKLQVRLPLGIEQYELEGRPDGLHPEGRESWLEYYIEKVESDPEPTPRLSREDCEKLSEEGVLYYHRYLLCFQICDYDRVIRDARRNLRMFDLVHDNAERDEDRVRVDQYRPYVLRMLAASNALKLAAVRRFSDARRALQQAILDIERLDTVNSEAFVLEQRRSLSVLRGMIQEMSRRMPGDLERLEHSLELAIATEDYERAAEIRDEIRKRQDSLRPDLPDSLPDLAMPEETGPAEDG